MSAGSIISEMVSVSPNPNEETHAHDDESMELKNSIEKLEAEREQLREALANQVRIYDQFVSILSAKIEAKEKELRHFLVPRPIVSENDCDQQSAIVAPIQSTVPAVRPVPTLIGGSTKSADGILGPAYSATSLSSSDMTTSNQTVSNRNLAETKKDSSLDTLTCCKVPIDPSVYAVFCRLRRLQNQCNTLITSNQADLQSFTFTQNSQNGKRIMTRLRVLEKENEELASAKRTGRTACLETEVTLRRYLVRDMKQAFADMEFLIEEVEGETELFGNSLLMLQQRLHLTRTTAQLFANKLDSIVPGRASEVFNRANWTPFDVEESRQIMEVDNESPSELAMNTYPEAATNALNGICPTGSEGNLNDNSSDQTQHQEEPESPDPTVKSRPIIPVDGPQRTLNYEPQMANPPTTV